jgi:hypothetical protein
MSGGFGIPSGAMAAKKTLEEIREVTLRAGTFS